MLSNSHFCVTGLTRILLLMVFHISLSLASMAAGPCKNTNRGFAHRKCKLTCTAGSCTESYTEETCDCSENAVFLAGWTEFKVSMYKLSFGIH